MKIIIVNRKHKFYALVDDSDYDELIEYTWYCTGNKYTRYAYRFISKSRRVLMHREILGIAYGDKSKIVDHKNHNGLDNRRCNIRVCTYSDNQKNKVPSGSSKYLGVNLHTTKVKHFRKKTQTWVEYKSTGWRSAIKVDGKHRHIGMFGSEEAAAIAYDKEAIKHHGEFANLNFPKAKQYLTHG